MRLHYQTKILLTVLLFIFAITTNGQTVQHEKIEYSPLGNLLNAEPSEFLSEVIKIPIQNPEPFIAIGLNATLSNEIDDTHFYIRVSENGDSWSDWVVSASSTSDSAYVSKQCSRINDALQTVGRAFGHRIHQAIDQYVANYPSWVDGRREKAFADQMEQKILPKLRGLSHDTDDGLEHVFNVIGDVISELNDSALADAFAAAREKPVFDFKGVNREA